MGIEVVAGAVAVVAAVRMLIKGLHHRNAAERRSANVRLVREQLEVLREFGLLDDRGTREACAERLLAAGERSARPERERRGSR